VRYTVRPISDRSWLGTTKKEATRFSAKWTATEQLLLDEIGHLGGKDVVLEIDVREQDFKLNGELRANAKATSPAVAIAFESKHGPLFYRCDRFYAQYYGQGEDWQHNARAIALTLQALRAVDRYGATETGQQYTGFKALGAGRAMPASHMTRTEAAALLDRVAIGPDAEPDDDAIPRILASEALAKSALRSARGAAHPDRNGGDQTLWDQVEQAGKVLGLIS
jgi:hypothetical protein